jgi:hypothetical protein
MYTTFQLDIFVLIEMAMDILLGLAGPLYQVNADMANGICRGWEGLRSERHGAVYLAGSYWADLAGRCVWEADILGKLGEVRHNQRYV